MRWTTVLNPVKMLLVICEPPDGAATADLPPPERTVLVKRLQSLIDSTAAYREFVGYFGRDEQQYYEFNLSD